MSQTVDFWVLLWLKEKQMKRIIHSRFFVCRGEKEKVNKPLDLRKGKGGQAASGTNGAYEKYGWLHYCEIEATNQLSFVFDYRIKTSQVIWYLLICKNAVESL